ncbi:winged helix DNA-binding protein [Streptomyces bathyalis]|uniref:Winged helix DNA-binding protein n=1 Tax=Streptomyces bathyalis TaxID=2710756 RepID=A0A7T1WTJ4_9ACTN|nr:winged helix DNA-binding protein [Streptomyces bathyalis]
MLDHTCAGLPVELGEDVLAVLTEQEARQEAGRRLTPVASLTALGSSDALATAELFVADRRRRSFVPGYLPSALSHAQSTILRSVARGDVAITDDKPHLRREGIRVSISTIRALENRGLVMREDCPDRFRDEHVHLTAAGRRDLAASFARPRPAGLTTTRPATPLPTAPAGRAR